jgi:hypothetical protein
MYLSSYKVPSTCAGGKDQAQLLLGRNIISTMVFGPAIVHEFTQENAKGGDWQTRIEASAKTSQQTKTNPSKNLPLGGKHLPLAAVHNSYNKGLKGWAK